VVDEGDDHFDGRSSSAAKKAEALFRISLARFASANSARNRRFSASKSSDSVGVALPESLCLRTQTRKVSLLRPSSFATRVIAPFAVSGSAWAWMTSSTARALRSSVYFTGTRESPSSNLPASIIPGAIQPAEPAETLPAYGPPQAQEAMEHCCPVPSHETDTRSSKRPGLRPMHRHGQRPVNPTRWMPLPLQQPACRLTEQSCESHATIKEHERVCVSCSRPENR